MNAPLYTTEILRLAASLQGPCELERIDGEADIRSPTCGSRVTLAVTLDAKGLVEQLSQEVHACAFGQASAAILERHALGCGHSEVSNALLRLRRWLADPQEPAVGWPGMDVLAPARTRKGRHGAILLPFRALLAAIESAESRAGVGRTHLR